MINFYTVVIFSCILSLISLAIDVGKNTIFSSSDVKWFRATFLLVAVGALCEWGGIIFNNYHSEPNWIHALTTLTEFSITPFLTIFLARSCGMRHKIKFFLIIMSIHCILEIALLPFGGIFYIDDEGIFQRGAFYAIYMIFCGISFIYIMYVFALIGKQSGLRNIPALILIIIITVVGQTACILDGNIYTGYISITLTAILLYNYIQNFIRLQMMTAIDLEQEIINHDALTGVSSRTHFEKKEKEIDQSIVNNQDLDFAICICDINNLKFINDNLGHDEGDIYIKKCCKSICDYFKHSPVFRIGGDEFAVLLLNEDLRFLDDIKKDLNAFSIYEATKISDIEKRTSYSSGFAIYNPDKDKSFSDVFKRADAEMYKNKKELKSMMRKNNL